MSKYTTLYQHGTLALLVPGLLSGTLTMGDLLKHGDTGIGTGEGLDGELIILDGKPYQVDSDGNVNEVSNSFNMPFANSHFAKYSPLAELEDVSQDYFEEQIISLTHASNTFFSVKVTGSFSNVKTRAVKKSVPPFQTLAETAKNQSIFTRDHVEGTLISYYSPKLFDGAAVGGCHNHFLSDDHTFGGHLLDFHLDKGDVSYQLFDTLEQHLPIDNKAYMDHDFSKDNITDDIHNAEG
ncbi:acetolactate decarboxylase [Lentilactobacillus kefiri]|uniref:Alpha-acetolactate decarboxylase n=2 Tax=Lentilactobacillus kefiri TaxID=33962 RepID=A0A8E1RKJ1_LENKE|nr:acetolactate decarboxylase [Lentilactobacillus kefiri]KRL75507.1 alpha-acetolactate decarboxylase [Lentilactobacillus parakefiri DSM 10551]KRM53603.1 alpha-acetolactate decarboxylase [Lentilactobacillus kefiri DSM 20587 = JCM 5818]MCJ2161074.1 acetolactate decarboxylase [Lentilactobacillus kefiri]MCP9369389.1 acetolactate decarboxylase [Lentilactobacillus kefiri]MDH5109418.1 acetolactate decarboxylase [Lentilactobacillus kefiri]